MARTVRPALIFASAALLAACNGTHSPERAPAAAVAGPVRFVQQSSPAAAPPVVARGVLEVDDHGCLRLNDRALQWPVNAALDLSQPGSVRVFSRDEGRSVRVGEAVTLLATPQPAAASPACPGPQLAVSAFSPTS